MDYNYLFSILLLTLLIMPKALLSYKLRIIKVKMGINGMDGGIFGIKSFGGGRLSFQICQGGTRLEEFF